MTALSVVIVPLGGEGDLARCLEALRSQGASEIIVAEGRTPAAARAAALQRASSPIVALTEDHCVPAPDWCARIRRAHERGYAVVGGCIEKLAPDTALNWAIYLADYLRYAPPMAAGPVTHLSDCNVSYQRATLEGIAGLWKDEFHENVVHEALRRTGGTLWLEPEVVVRQKRRFNAGTALSDRFCFGRIFAASRLAGAPLDQRLLLLASTLALPALLILRVSRQVAGRRRHKIAFLRALPWLAALCSAWALGEFTGYLTGKPE